MKAIIRSSAGLLGLLLLASPALAQDRIWVSAVTRQPLGYAPSPSNSGGYYLVNSYGMVYGPNYCLTPPFQPFNGFLPGPIGNAIMAGNLPHTLLMSKDAMTIGNMPMLAKRGHGHGQPAPTGPMPPTAPMAGMNQMNPGPMPYPPPMGATAPYPPQMGRPYWVQMPYGGVPTSPFPMHAPYAMPMPAAAPAPMGPPIAYVPYVGPPGMYQLASRNPQTGVWQVQNVMPGQAAPFAPIPGFRPPPSGDAPALQPFDPFGRVQGPQPPQLDWQGMQLPRMEGYGPPPPPRGMPYPTHPFTRSPRDFFMWGDAMDEERARGNRPFPVP